MRGRSSPAYPMAKVREVVRELVLNPEYTSSDLDDIRLDVAFKFTGSRSWGSGTEQQVYSVLQQMTVAGELVKEGGLEGPRNYRRRSSIHYYTPERFEKVKAEREARREARQQLQDEWLAVRVALGAKLNEDVRADKHGKPDLDLDTWQEVLRLMV